MTLTMTPKTEALLLARAQGEGQDINTLADTLLADLLGHDEAKAADEPALVLDADAMNGDIRAAAKVLAAAAREAAPDNAQRYFYFHRLKKFACCMWMRRPDRHLKTRRLHHSTLARIGAMAFIIRLAVTLIRPEEEGNRHLPDGWGTWEDAVAI